MRRSRIRARIESRGRSISFIIIFVVLLPMVSIGLGYFGAKYFILPNLLSKKIVNEGIVSEEKEKNTEIKEEQLSENIKDVSKDDVANTFEFQGLDIYTIQVGSFSTVENAQLLASELTSKGMGAFVWNNDGYKVMTIAMLDRQSIDLLKPAVLQEYEGAFVVTTSIPICSINYKKEDTHFFTVLKEQNKKLFNIFKNISEIVKKSQMDIIDEKEYKDLIQENIQNVKNVIQEQKNEKASTDMESLEKEFEKMEENLMIGLEAALNSKGEKSLVQVQNTLMRALYGYIDIVTQNSK